MKKDVSIFTVLIAFTIIIGLGILGLSFIRNRQENKLFSLVPGEQIKYFDLIDINDREMSAGSLKEDISILYIFGMPCVECNANLTPWITMTQYFSERIRVVGIIPDGDPAAFRFAKDGNLNFQLYIPRDIKKFQDKFRLKLNDSQTLVINNGIVKAVVIGDLGAREYEQLIRITRALIQNRRKV